MATAARSADALPLACPEQHKSETDASFHARAHEFHADRSRANNEMTTILAAVNYDGDGRIRRLPKSLPLNSNT